MSGEVPHGYDQLRHRFTAGESEGATQDSISGRIAAMGSLSDSSRDVELSRQLAMDASDRRSNES